METHVSIAKLIPIHKLKIWSSTQSPFALRDMLASFSFPEGNPGSCPMLEVDLVEGRNLH